MNLLHEIGSHLTGLAQLKVMMTNDLRPGIGKTLDIRLIEVEEGRVVLEATPDVHLYNPIGTVHGGFAAPMLDFACGYAVLSKLTSGMGFSTLELKVAYHKAISKDTAPFAQRGPSSRWGGGRRSRTLDWWMRMTVCMPRPRRAFW